MIAGQIRTALIFQLLRVLRNLFLAAPMPARICLPVRLAKRLTRIAGFELTSSEVRVKSRYLPVTPRLPTCQPEIKTVFKLETDKEGRWRVAEIRTGQGRWEEHRSHRGWTGARRWSEAIAMHPIRAVRGKVAVDPSVKRARCLLGHLLGVEIPSDAIRIQEVNPMPIPMASQPSATVVAWLRSGRAANASEKSGWHVTELRTGNRDWVKLEPFPAALNQQKRKLAAFRTERSPALWKFRRDRGFICRFRQTVGGDRFPEPSLPAASNSSRSLEPALQVSR